jgi:hypothetical protein
MMVKTDRIDGNQRYGWTKNQRSWFRDPDTTTQPSPQDHQLMPKRRVLGFKPQPRFERGGEDRQRETEKPDHPTNLGDFVTSSTRTRFSVHTDMTLMRFVASSKNVGSRRLSLENLIVRSVFATTRRPIRLAMSLSVASADLRIGGASPLVTTSSREIFSLRCVSSPCWRTGCDLIES